MKLENDDALDFARGPGVCDWCKGRIAGREPHHIFSKGAGQVDIKSNIAAICRVCHTSVHFGEIDDNDILAVVAGRENVLQGDIEAVVWLIRRMPKISEMTAERYERIVSRELNYSARRLAMKELESFRHLLRES